VEVFYKAISGTVDTALQHYQRSILRGLNKHKPGQVLKTTQYCRLYWLNNYGNTLASILE